MTTASVIRFNPIFEPVFRSRHRYRVLKGSAGSGKSVNIAQDYIVKLMSPEYKGANLLVVRKSETTNKDSTYAELVSAANRISGTDVAREWAIRLNPMSITSRLTGNSVIFRGMNDARQREKVKSITFRYGKLTWIWIEEATELDEMDVDILDDRLRGELSNPNLYYQMTFTFNPVSSAHWLKRRYFDTPSPNVFTHHSTYKDNQFIDAAYHERMERRKIEDPEGYMVYGLGEWGETGGLILTNIAIEEFPDAPERFDSRVYGQDFGFNHANAILDVRFRDGEIYVCNEIYVHERDTTEIIALADRAGLDKKVRMWCDSAEPDRIQMWCNAGYNAASVKKESGSVRSAIDYLKAHKIHVHPRCANTVKEIQTWKWKRDRNSGQYTDDPMEVYDDAMAALRYAVDELRKHEPPFVPWTASPEWL